MVARSDGCRARGDQGAGSVACVPKREHNLLVLGVPGRDLLLLVVMLPQLLGEVRVLLQHDAHSAQQG